MSFPGPVRCVFTRIGIIAMSAPVRPVSGMKAPRESSWLNSSEISTSVESGVVWLAALK